jgi:hypothetical protein
MLSKCFGIAVFLLACGFLVAVPKDRVPDKYQTLLAQLKQGDRTVDFLEIRRAYADSPEFIDGSDPDERKAMFTAFNKGDFSQALEHSKKILASITWTSMLISSLTLPIVKCTFKRRQIFTTTSPMA